MEIRQLILTFFTDFMKILGEMSPYLLLGFFFAGLLHAFIPRRKIEKYFSGSPLRSSVLASVFGIPLPLCSCGVIPTGMAFYKNGASKGGTVSFLISTPQTGVDSILATFSLMGLPFAIIRPVAALITGITGGLITSVVTRKEAPEEVSTPVAAASISFAQRILLTFRYGFVVFIQDIAKWLVIGLLLAAAISALIPDDFFQLMELPLLLQMLMILVISVPLYICATGSIPLAAVLILKGISPGAAFVLLMAGPATNVATMTMMGKVLGRRSLIAYLATIIAGALGTGLLIDAVLPARWFADIARQHLGHEHHEVLAWWQIASGVILLALIANGYLQRYLLSRRMAKQKAAQPQFTLIRNEVQILNVSGMTCNNCKANVEAQLLKQANISKAEADLAGKNVRIEGEDLDMERIKDSIRSLGYSIP